MGRGRPPSQRTPEERLAIRRANVRRNVQAHREREKLKRSLSTLKAQPQPKLRWIQETKWSQKQPKPQKESKATEIQVTKSNTRKSRPAAQHSLIREPSPEPQNNLALLGMFRSKFLPDRIILPTPGASDDRLTTPCAPWVVKAHELASLEEKPLLKDILRALALGQLGAEQQREDIQVVAFHAYQRMLSALKRQLDSLMRDRSHKTGNFLALFLCCHAASIFELNVNASLPDTFRHVRGLGSLLVHQAGASDLVPGVLFDLVEEYRLLEVVFCLIYREESVLAASNLCRVPKAGEKQVAAPERMCNFSSLIYIARHLPPIMVRLDEQKAIPGARNQSLREFRLLLQRLSDVLRRLEEWCDDFLTLHAQPVVQSPAYVSGYGELDFPNLELASTWTYCLSFKLLTLDTYIDIHSQINSRLPSQENSNSFEGVSGCLRSDSFPKIGKDELSNARTKLLSLAQLLTRSLQYFFVADVGFIGRSLVVFPLETARLAFVHEFERESNSPLYAPGVNHSNFMNQRSQEIGDGLMVCKSFQTKANALKLPLFSNQ